MARGLTPIKIKSNRGGTAHFEWYGDELFRDVQGNVKVVEYESAKRVFNDARVYVPVGKIIRLSGGKDWMRRVPGTLKSSIKMFQGKYGGRLVWAGDMLAVYYAHFVEFGTVFTKKRRGERFMRKAINREKLRFVNALKAMFTG